MGFNRVTWSPGHERKPVESSRFRELARLRRQREARARESTAAHALAGSLMSLAALLGSEVSDPDGRSVGRLRDVVVHWTTRGVYPRVKAIVLNSGKQDVRDRGTMARGFAAGNPCGCARPGCMRARSSVIPPMSPWPTTSWTASLSTPAVYRSFARPISIWPWCEIGIELVGIEVGVRALLRRLGPKRLRTRLHPDRVIDWGSITAFVPARDDGERHRGRRSDLAGQAGAGLALDRSAGEVKRLKPSDIQAALDEAAGQARRRFGVSAVDTPASGRHRRVAKLPRWLKAVLGLLAILGPGLISANAGNDAGGIITYASAGAQFGYRTLFLMVLITVALVVVQEMCSRLGAYTGEGLGALIREQFPLRSGAAAMVLLFVANAGLTVSEFAGVGASMELFGVSRYIAVPLALVGIWAVTVLGNYSRAERVFLVMGLVFLAYPIAAFLGHPHAGAVFSNLLWPHFLHSKAFLLLAVALIGTTITPYMQFYLTSAVVDKGVTPKTYKAERIDTVNGAILGDLVSIFIIIATAAAIGGTGPLNTVGQAAAALEPGRRRGRLAPVRVRPAGRVAARRDGRAALDLVRDRRDGGRRALAVTQAA